MDSVPAACKFEGGKKKKRRFASLFGKPNPVNFFEFVHLMPSNESRSTIPNAKIAVRARYKVSEPSMFIPTPPTIPTFSSFSLRSTMAGKLEPYYTPSGAGILGYGQFRGGWVLDCRKSSSWLEERTVSCSSPVTSLVEIRPQGLKFTIAVSNLKSLGIENMELGTKAESLYALDGNFAKYNVYANNGTGFTNPGSAAWDQTSSCSSSPSGSYPHPTQAHLRRFRPLFSVLNLLPLMEISVPTFTRLLSYLHRAESSSWWNGG
ncbi:hypothetical protein D9757_015051 [Collybiopsis confluens]|uniref:Uncharacterized protein n=1 Tax=Collybiopsis confluens TaxID=2823264 RepID=A0A8H5FFJ9_9AGAR|nr:hypothetical protein D9757_015051 [Collybiopsis confluens]